ncbi:MAG: DUF2064 domain-containing protein [Candidatus Limnocylindrales bacterium]
MRVAAVIPTLNEAIAVGDVVRGLLRQADVCCVLVVDSASTDGTPEAARLAGAIVLPEPRRGYGRACRTGAAAALGPMADNHWHEAIAFLDGDGSCDPGDIGRLIRGLDGADVVLGRRPRGRLERGAMPWHAFVGNLVVAGLATLLTGRTVHDFPPSKVIRSDALRRLTLDDDRFGWTAQLVTRALADRSLRIAEVPVAFLRRRGGSSKVSGSWRASILAGRAMLGTVVRERRSRPVLALMAKAPRAGHAKTRLAAHLGESLTAELWAACLADAADGVAAAARDSRSTWMAMVPSGSDVDPVRAIIGPTVDIRVQTTPGLSGALADVFRDAAARGADRAVAIAGDSPTLGSGPVQATLFMLDRSVSGAVLGPTHDGGYHLVGLRLPVVARRWPSSNGHRHPDLERRLKAAFGEQAMGTPTALDQTREALRGAGWTIRLGSEHQDLDTIDDLRELADGLAADGRSAPRTADWARHHQAVIDSGRNDATMEGPPNIEPEERGARP